MTAIELRGDAVDERSAPPTPPASRQGRVPKRGPGRVARPGFGLGGRAALVGAVAGVIGYLGAGVPSYWGDEAASVLSAQRPWSSLALELSQVDAVHGAYYALLHLWIDAFGAGEWSTRALSSIATGLMAAGVVVLGTRWFDARVGLAAGLIVAVLPRVTGLAIEARSYALAAAAAVWLTVLFTELQRRRVVSRRAWIGYGIAVAACGALFFYLLLMPMVHAVALVAAHRRPPAQLVRRWLIGLVVGAMLVLPLVLLDASQREQVAFLAHRHQPTAANVLGGQWFGGPLVAVPMQLLVVAAVVGAVVAPRALRARALRALAPALTWLVWPTAALLAVSVAVAPSYNPRYLVFSAPAAAIVAAVGLATIADHAA
ncbi:MAG TPA: glycosyltransferase family 39 protein, partial [Agromyces sp.]